MQKYKEKWVSKEQAALYKVFRSYVPVETEITCIVQKIREKGLQRIDTLDIGAGEGSVALKIVSSLKEAGIAVLRWDALDVSEEHLSSFGAKVSNHIKPEFNFYLKGWNEFPLKKQYDFVLARHSWYGVEKWKEETREINSLMKLYEAIKKGGLGLIVLSPKDDVLFAIPNPFQGDTTSEDVCEALERIGIEFYCERVARPLPALLEGGELTEPAYGIFKYILHTENISEIERLKKCLTEWFSKHKKWVSKSDLIWINK